VAETASRRRADALPPPLPPATRTVGQLVAETIKLYGERFWRVLPLGLSVAALDEVAFGRSLDTGTLLVWAFGPLLTLSYIAAAAIAAGVKPTRRSALVAFGVGLLVFVPFPVLFRLFVLPGLALFAFYGLAVPAAIVERLSPRGALRRGSQLGKADFVHALGSLSTLAIVYFLSRTVLLLLLRGQGQATERIAGFLADLVLSPLLFLGAALLYFDQAARVGLPARGRSVRSSARGR
jgi:hypothetical protein